MIGLLYLGFFAAYLWLSVFLTKWAARQAKKRGIASWKWGLPMGLIMYNLVFWDWLPLEITYRYDCSHYAGFTQNQTLAQWKKENPGVAETLRPSKDLHSTREGNRERYVLNQRFAWDIRYTPHWFHIQERDERIVDLKTGEVLARYVDFSTDIQGVEVGSDKTISDYKIWLGKGSCEPEGGKINRINFYRFKHQLQDTGG